ncbi:conjugative transfer protein MobI(A/C) [Ectothiorhodospira marina]|uniref:Uncharacterized protein n=1 Tax=Ectothiorhodospira marina TaxID=1396821 RepID=A0A1H7IWD8_9GAMM|nr:conjugative transfer protein MobI(A/C) [Ectothiorhodospira marina]SEK65970.1 hypothetical protein SAMN05444515_1042 [Ectothiorhodospira marina]
MSGKMSRENTIKMWNQVGRDKTLKHDQGMKLALQQSRAMVQSGEEALEIEQARLGYLTQLIANNFWNHNLAHRTDKTPGYPGHHGCRVRHRGRKLEISWYYNSFHRKPGSESKRVFSEHICKDGQHRYYKTAFNRAQPWEKTVILETEAGFELARKINANNTKIRRLFDQNRKLLAELETHLNTMTEPE